MLLIPSLTCSLVVALKAWLAGIGIAALATYARRASSSAFACVWGCVGIEDVRVIWTEQQQVSLVAKVTLSLSYLLSSAYQVLCMLGLHALLLRQRLSQLHHTLRAAVCE